MSKFMVHIDYPLVRGLLTLVQQRTTSGSNENSAVGAPDILMVCRTLSFSCDSNLCWPRLPELRIHRVPLTGLPPTRTATSMSFALGPTSALFPPNLSPTTDPHIPPHKLWNKKYKDIQTVLAEKAEAERSEEGEARRRTLRLIIHASIRAHLPTVGWGKWEGWPMRS
jgi:hypothetical protein